MGVDGGICTSRLVRTHASDPRIPKGALSSEVGKGKSEKRKKRRQAVLDEKAIAAVVVVVARTIRVHGVGGRGRSVDMSRMRGAGCSARRGNYMGAER